MNDFLKKTHELMEDIINIKYTILYMKKPPNIKQQILNKLYN